jgi:hypothetical protein
MLIEPREVFYRFAALFEAAEDMENRSIRTV